MKRVKLIGGSRNGETVEVTHWQPVIYMSRKVMLVEMKSLAEGAHTMYRPSEDVYTKNSEGNFIYDHTVHYDPKHPDYHKEKLQNESN